MAYEKKDNTKEIAICEQSIQALEIDFSGLVSQYDEQVKMSFKKEAQFALQTLQSNSFLLSTAMRNPASLKNAILNIASIGVSLNPAKKEAYLVPRGGQVCLDVSYMGLVSISSSSGAVDFVQAKIVRNGESFTDNGPGLAPTHTHDPFKKDKGEIIGVYCVASTTSGHFLTEIMSYDECIGIRDRTEAYKAFAAGKTKSCPWVTDEGEMLKKTVIKRAAKLWPKGDANKVSRIDKAVHVLNESDEGIDFKAEQAIEERKQIEADDFKVKNELIESIKLFCSSLTEGKELADKGIFMRDNLKVKSFGELIRKKEKEIEEILSNL